MPTQNLSEEKLIAINTLLNLHEKYLQLAFAVLTKRIISSYADFLLKRGGFSTLLLSTYNSAIDDILEVNISGHSLTFDYLFSISTFSYVDQVSYNKIQFSYGDLKSYSDSNGAYGKEMSVEAANMMSEIDDLLDGKKPRIKILLSECIISGYNLNESEIKINDTFVSFRGMAQNDYFCKVMFSFPVKTEVSWDDLNLKIKDRYGVAEGFTSSDSLLQSMYRINTHIKNTVGTGDDFFTQKRKIITREFGT